MDKVLNGSFGFPKNCVLPGSDMIPHVIVGGEGFRLHNHIMKPYTKQASRNDITKKIFNYRLSRARRVTENAFGLLSQFFRVFYHPINTETSTCENLIWVACYQHNMLRNGYLEKYNYNKDESTPEDNMLSLSRREGFSNIEDFEVREFFKSYFNREGSVLWEF